jgi:hypothetical protein
MRGVFGNYSSFGTSLVTLSLSLSLPFLLSSPALLSKLFTLLFVFEKDHECERETERRKKGLLKKIGSCDTDIS